MRLIIFFVLLLAGCDSSTPVTTTVKKNQPDHQHPKYGSVTWSIGPANMSPCPKDGPEPYGCVFGVGTRQATIYIHEDHSGWEMNKVTIQAVLDHEFDHVIYGPMHTGE